MTSSSTTSLGDIVRVPDCRRTNGFAWPRIARLSSVCFARSSWIIPMMLLAMISRPNIPLITEPVARTISSSTPRIALILVNTLARTIWATLRVARSGMSLLLPSANRAATSASVKPMAVIA